LHAYNDEVTLAGVIIYESEIGVHGQYAASNEIGKKCGPQTCSWLPNDSVFQEEVFDCGILTEKGAYLNRGLA
jgi:hypothetical protein